MQPSGRPLSPKIPTVARISFAMFTVMLGVRGVAAQAPLTEAEVIRLARERGAGAALAAASDALASAREHATGRMPNPSLQWARETVSANTRITQDIVTANLPIDVAAPLAERSLGAAEASTARAEASLSRSEAVVAALQAFYEARVAGAQGALLAESVASLQEAGRVLERRQTEGTASGYETSRLHLGPRSSAWSRCRFRCSSPCSHWMRSASRSTR